MEPRISVVTLGVADLARSYRFYRDGLGLPTTRRPGGRDRVLPDLGCGACLVPLATRLAADIGPGSRVVLGSRFTGIYLGAQCA